jgi:hypothetical protein
LAKSASRLRFELATKSSHDFQGLFSNLLGELMDGAAQTKRLGQMDRMGLDAISIDSDGARCEIAIQCKGFEVLEYGNDQHKQCRAEIRKYQKKGIPAGEYWLVVNRPIKVRSQRRELEGDLAALVKSGKVERAILLDSEATINKLQRLAAAKLAHWAKEKRTELFAYYADRMQFVQYIDNVPFNENLRGPVDHIFERVKTFFENLPADQTGKYRRPPKILLTSEFGFGKTSTLQSLAGKWLQSGRNLIYVPAALLNDDAFRHTTGLTNTLLSFLVPEEADVGELAFEVFRDTLRSSLNKSKDWLVLIDGLDENAAALKANGLIALWNSMSDLGVPAIISVRDELVELRQAEFFPDPRMRLAPVFERLRLNDWPQELVAKFVKLFSAARGGVESLSYGAFRTLVESGQYAEAYGDIPKRPLFLGMLADDAWAGERACA